jgi:hypothetical protein
MQIRVNIQAFQTPAFERAVKKLFPWDTKLVEIGEPFKNGSGYVPVLLVTDHPYWDEVEAAFHLGQEFQRQC